MQYLQLEESDIQGVFKIRRFPAVDFRGSFSRIFSENDMWQVNWKSGIRQVNLSSNKERGTLRGLHFQRYPKSDIKIVTVLRGKIWDVVVDLRENSKTYLKWQAFLIDSTSEFSLLVPEGCAHGFQTLEDFTDILYLHSELFYPELDGGIHPEDPVLAIDWPLDTKIMSLRDSNLPNIDSIRNKIQ